MLYQQCRSSLKSSSCCMLYILYVFLLVRSIIHNRESCNRTYLIILFASSLVILGTLLTIYLNKFLSNRLKIAEFTKRITSFANCLNHSTFMSPNISENKTASPCYNHSGAPTRWQKGSRASDRITQQILEFEFCMSAQFFSLKK